MQVLLGADPEVFVKKNGVPICAHNMIPGTKKTPHTVTNGAVQVDGFALEFNIDPAKTETEFVHNIQTVFKTLESMIPKDCTIHAVPSVHFDWAHIKQQPDEARMLGCDPDYNAYTGAVNDKPNGETDMRTAAGHIHIGWTRDADPFEDMHFRACMALTKQLDYYLGIPSLMLDSEGEERRKLYGKAGAFRPKPYGCEYRVLSNFWLTSPELMRWVYVTTQRAVADLMSDQDMGAAYGELAESIINGERSALDKLANVRSGHPELWERINPIVDNKLRGVE